MSYVLDVPGVAPNPRTKRRKYTMRCKSTRKRSTRKRTTRSKCRKRSSTRRSTARKRNPAPRKRSRRRPRRNPKVFGVDLVQALTVSGTAVGLDHGLKQLLGAKYRSGFLGAGIKAAFRVVVGMAGQKLKLLKPSTAKTIQVGNRISG